MGGGVAMARWNDTFHLKYVDLPFGPVTVEQFSIPSPMAETEAVDPMPPLVLLSGNLGGDHAVLVAVGCLFIGVGAMVGLSLVASGQVWGWLLASPLLVPPLLSCANYS